MLNIKFNPTELETISDFKELMRYDKLEEILTDGELLNGKFENLNTYFSNLDKLVEFKPVFSARESIFKFDRDRWLMTRKAFAKELEKLKTQYEQHSDNIYAEIIDRNNRLYSFLMNEPKFFRGQLPQYVRNTGVANVIFVNFDGYTQNIPCLDACPSLSVDEQDIISDVIDTIFNYCFKADKTNEWAKVVCECSLRESLEVEDEEVKKRLEKLTDYMRHGVDADTAEKLFLYKDMIEEKAEKNGTKFWRVYLPNYGKADKAWINVKHENVSELDTDADMVKVFLTKDIAYNIHYLKGGKLKTKWADSSKEIIAPLKEISDKYEAWQKDSQNPTFAKKLAVLGIDKEKENFTVAINNGEYYVAIDFSENEIQGSLYNNIFHLEDGCAFALKDGEENLKIIGRIFERLLGANAHNVSSLAKCDQDVFKAKVAENKKISDYKLIAAIDEMSANDDKRSDLIKAMAKQAS